MGGTLKLYIYIKVFGDWGWKGEGKSRKGKKEEKITINAGE